MFGFLESRQTKKIAALGLGGVLTLITIILISILLWGPGKRGVLSPMLRDDPAGGRPGTPNVFIRTLMVVSVGSPVIVPIALVLFIAFTCALIAIHVGVLVKNAMDAHANLPSSPYVTIEEDLEEKRKDRLINTVLISGAIVAAVLVSLFGFASYKKYAFELAQPKEVPKQQLNVRFIVGKVLGSGGYGVVHEGFDRSFNENVAIKMIRPDKLFKNTKKPAPLQPKSVKKKDKKDIDAKKEDKPNIENKADSGKNADATKKDGLSKKGDAMEEKKDDKKKQAEEPKDSKQLKLEHERAIEDERRNLKHEAKVLKELSHPNIIKYIDYLSGQTSAHSDIFIDDTISKKTIKIKSDVLILELFGTRLSRSMKLEKEVDIKRIMFQLFSALDYLHERCGLKHMDIKLDNILVNDKKDIKLIDFGMAMKKEAPGARKGTTEYMAPEVISAEKATPYTEKADIWSAAVAIVSLFSDPYPNIKRSLKDDDDDKDRRKAELAAFLKNEGKPDTSRVPEFCKHIVSKCLETDPAKRPSARQVLDDSWFESLLPTV